MIAVVVKYTEPGVVADTGLIYEALEHEKIMDCSSVIALPEMLSVRNSTGKACSFFYDTMTKLTIDGKSIEKFTMKDIVTALTPSKGGNG